MGDKGGGLSPCFPSGGVDGIFAMDDLRVCKLNGGDLAGVSWLTQGVLGSPCKLHPVLGLEDPVLEPHAVCAHSLEAIDAVATADGLLKFTIRYKRITCVTLHHVSNINSGEGETGDLRGVDQVWPPIM